MLLEWFYKAGFMIFLNKGLSETHMRDINSWDDI